MENTSENRVDLSKVEIRPLDPDLGRAAFSCGHQRIDNFCKNNAKKQHSQNKVRVYDAIFDGGLIGYYYLVAASNPPEEVSEVANEKFGRVKQAPCVYLGMVGVDEKFKGQSVGKLLMSHAMKTTLQVADLIGLYALTLHAVDAEVAKFYEKLGFEYFIDGDLAMFIPLATIRDSFS